jgi:hypothetical protein
MVLSRTGMFIGCIVWLRIGRETPQISNIMLILCSLTPFHLAYGQIELGGD